MGIERGYQVLLEQITIWCPIHDWLTGNEDLQKEALAYLQGKIPAARIQPPDWLAELFQSFTPEDLAFIHEAKSNGEAYDRIIKIRSQHRSGSAPINLASRPETRGRGRGRKRIPEAEYNERLRLAPHMSAEAFAEYFHIHKNTAATWCSRHGVHLNSCRKGKA